MTYQKPTLGMMSLQSQSLQSQMSPLARSCGEFSSKLHSRLEEQAGKGGGLDTTSQLTELRCELDAAAAKLSGGVAEEKLKEVDSVDTLLLEAIRAQQQQQQ